LVLPLISCPNTRPFSRAVSETKPPTLSSPPVAGTMPACEEKNWPAQLALDGAAACEELVAATATTIPAITALILVRLTIEKGPPVDIEMRRLYAPQTAFRSSFG
jgi:hypothetical protein